ncbi:MAG: DUF4139 domain-containing protein [Bacteroidales bacterium]
MKKNIIIVIAILFVGNLAFSQTENKLYPKINKVTVFSASAQIEKGVLIDLKPGFNEVILCGNSPYLRKQSIQFNNSSDFIITEFTPYIQKVRNDISAEEKLDSKTKAQLEKYKDSLKVLEKEIYDNTKYRRVYYNENNVLTDLQSACENDTSLSVVKMKEVLSFYRNRSIEIKSLIYKNEKEFYRLEDRKRDLELSIKLILQGDKEKVDENKNEYFIKLTLYTQRENTSLLEYRYSVNRISWTPFYDLKFNKSNNDAQFLLKTEFQQNTAEDWEDVKLVFSTQESEEQGEPIELQPMVYSLNSSIPKSNGTLVGTIVDAQTGEPLPFVNVVAQQNGINKGGGATDINGHFQIKPLSAGFYDVVTSTITHKKNIKRGVKVGLSGYSPMGVISLEGNTGLLDEVIVAVYNEEDEEDYKGILGYSTDFDIVSDDVALENEFKVTSFESASNVISIAKNTPTLSKEYEVEMNYSIKSGDKAKIIPLDEKKVKSFFKLNTVPKKEKIVYLSTLIPSWEELDLINAKAKIYIDESYVNDSYISINQTADTLSIPIGKEKRVVIDRKVSFSQPKKFNRKGTILETTVTIDITAKNNKDEVASIRIDDQVPVSNIEDIIIERGDLSGAIIDDKTGLLYWDIKLNPMESRSFKIIYTIRYPKTTKIAFD